MAVGTAWHGRGTGNGKADRALDALLQRGQDVLLLAALSLALGLNLL